MAVMVCDISIFQDLVLAKCLTFLTNPMWGRLVGGYTVSTESLAVAMGMVGASLTFLTQLFF